MKYLYQAAVIFLFTLLGELLAWIIPLPVPASIWGLLLLFAALCTGLVKPEKLKECSSLLIGLLPLLFVAPAVGLMDRFEALVPVLPAVIIILFAGTRLTFAAAGLSAQAMNRRNRKKEDPESAGREGGSHA